MELSSLLKILRDRIEIVGDDERSEAIFSYVDASLSKGRFSDDLYPLVKRMIDLAIASYDYQKYGYDQINVEKFTAVIDRFPLRERVKLLVSLRQKLIASGLEIDYYRINSKVQSGKYHELKWGSDRNFVIKKILYFPTVSAVHLVGTLAVVLTTIYIALLPSPLPIFASLEYKGYTYHDAISHLGFVLNIIFSTSDEIAVHPLNMIGTFQIGVAKVFAVVYGATFIVEEFKKRVNHI